MYRYSEIRKAHLEISSLCQASCPMCARNFHGGLSNPILKEKSLSLEFFKKAMPPEFIKQITSVSFCGNYGDSIMNNDLIEMTRYITLNNPTIHFDLHTNASARNAAWWKEFAEALPLDHIIHFGIDGLEDTHHLYRVGTSFKKIIENAKSFILAGGKARWNFITFKHNEHQLEDARQMSKDLNFTSFQEKQTSRFIGQDYFEVLDKNSKETHRLELPTAKKIPFISKETVENYKEVINSCTIDCEVETTKSVFIDAQGHLWPCCFLAGVPYHYTTPDKLAWPFMNESKSSLFKALEKFGGISGLDLNKHSMKDIVDSDVWQSMWNESFNNKSVLMCARVCGKFPNTEISQCRDQFVELEKF